jgi:hypothetical protein
MARMDLIDKRIDKLASAFGHYVRVHDEQVPFTSEQLAAHRARIALRPARLYPVRCRRRARAA